MINGAANVLINETMIFNFNQETKHKFPEH